MLHAEDEEEDEILGVIVAWCRQRRQRHMWVRSLIQRYQMFGHYNTLMAELERKFWGDFIGFMRKELGLFHELLMRLTPRLTKGKTNWRKALEPGLMLAVTLSYFATCSSYRDRAYAFNMPHNTISYS